MVGVSVKLIGREEGTHRRHARPSRLTPAAAVRRVGVVAAAVVLAAGCDAATGSQRNTAAGSTSPSPTKPGAMSRADSIAWARTLDPCALVDRDRLALLGAVNAYGTSLSSTTCAAHADDGTERGVDLWWSIAFLPTDFATSALGAIGVIDGVKVRTIDPARALPAESRGQLVESACSLDLAVDDAIAVRMSISMQRDRDACARGQQLVPTALSQWREGRKQGSSAATAVTVLTTASPCAVVPELQKSRAVTFEWNDQSLDTCFFKLDGDEVLVTMGYRARAQAAVGEPQTFDGHDGYQEVSATGTSDRAIVGAEFAGVDVGRTTRLVPLVEVSADNPVVASDVLAAVLKQLPI